MSGSFPDTYLCHCTPSNPDPRLRTETGMSHHHISLICAFSRCWQHIPLTKASSKSKWSSHNSLPKITDDLTTYLSYLMNRSVQTHLLAFPAILTKHYGSNTTTISRTLPQHMTNTLTLITTQLTLFITFPTPMSQLFIKLMSSWPKLK